MLRSGSLILYMVCMHHWQFTECKLLNDMPERSSTAHLKATLINESWLISAQSEPKCKCSWHTCWKMKPAVSGSFDLARPGSERSFCLEDMTTVRHAAVDIHLSYDYYEISSSLIVYSNSVEACEIALY